MNICSINRTFPGATEIDLSSAQTILDFDAAFIDANGLVPSRELTSWAIDFRRNEFSQFLALGRTIVVFIVPFQPEVFFPILAARLMPLSGKKVDFKGPNYLEEFWNAVEQDMQYFGYFVPVPTQSPASSSTPNFFPPPGRPFLFVHETNRPVATLIQVERGNLLLLPWLKKSPNDLTNRDTCVRFIQAFEKLNETLAPKKRAINLPDWSINYGWVRETELRKNLAMLQTQANEIEDQIKASTLKLGTEEKLKVLFTGKGDVLVDTVIKVFDEIGAKACHGEPGRDDIIVDFNGNNAVIEVKGKKNSAAESDAAQLEKWVAGFKAEKGIDPKAILLVNAFCETPLAERTEPAFPHQMLKYSKQREHCLITTTQLLGLLLEARAQPKKREDLIKSLFSTVGVYQQFADWRLFLTVAPSSGQTAERVSIASDSKEPEKYPT